MPLYGMILFDADQSVQFFAPTYKIIALAGTLLFTGLLPALPIYDDETWSNQGFVYFKREERTMPYLFRCFHICFGCFSVENAAVPSRICAGGSRVGIVGFLMVFINLKWKISAHLAGMGGFVGGIFGLFLPMWRSIPSV